MRVVIADDEKFVLVVLKSALRVVRFPIEIVGEALAHDDYAQALQQLAALRKRMTRVKRDNEPRLFDRLERDALLRAQICRIPGKDDVILLME